MTPDVLRGRYQLLVDALRDLTQADASAAGTSADDALLDFFDALTVLEDPEAVDAVPAAFLATVFGLVRVIGEIGPGMPKGDIAARFGQAAPLARHALLAVPRDLLGAADAAE